jgi:hypothetical protein
LQFGSEAKIETNENIRHKLKLKIDYDESPECLDENNMDGHNRKGEFKSNLKRVVSTKKPPQRKGDQIKDMKDAETLTGRKNIRVVTTIEPGLQTSPRRSTLSLMSPTMQDDSLDSELKTRRKPSAGRDLNPLDVEQLQSPIVGEKMKRPDDLQRHSSKYRQSDGFGVESASLGSVSTLKQSFLKGNDPCTNTLPQKPALGGVSKGIQERMKAFV